MLNESELTRLAVAIGEQIPEAHRGAVPLYSSASVIVFGNDGGVGDDRGQSTIRKARAVLAAEGFTLGPVATSPDRYTWLFEAMPPVSYSDPDAAADAAEEAVWEGWCATRDTGERKNGAELGGFITYQRGVAKRACLRFDADEVFRLM